MQLFEGYTADDLHRVLTTSRWVAGALLAGGFIALAVNQWLTHRISGLQKKERIEARQRLVHAEEELRRIRTQTTEVVSSFDKLTSPRKLTPVQVQAVKTTLGPRLKGKVVVTFLTVEWDAEEYAQQLAAVLKECGLEVKISDHLWVQMEETGVFMTCAEKDLPSAGIKLQLALEAAGVPAPHVENEDIPKAVGAAPGETVLVVSNRPDSPKTAK